MVTIHYWGSSSRVLWTFAAQKLQLSSAPQSGARNKGLWDGQETVRTTWPLAFVPVNSESQDVSKGHLSEVPLSWLLLQWIQMGCGGISGQIHALTPESTAEVETPISEGNFSAAAAKCHGQTKLLIDVTQRQHGKQAPGSSVLFQFFFSLDFFLRSVTRNDTEPAWRVELNVCGKIVNFRADSGVDVMAISEKKFHSPHSWANCGYSK